MTKKDITILYLDIFFVLFSLAISSYKKILSNDIAYSLLEDFTFVFLFFEKRNEEISWFIHIVSLKYTFRVKGTILRWKAINHFGV